MQTDAEVFAKDKKERIASSRGARFLRKCRIYQFWRFVVLNLLILKVAKNPPRKRHR